MELRLLELVNGDVTVHSIVCVVGDGLAVGTALGVDGKTDDLIVTSLLTYRR